MRHVTIRPGFVALLCGCAYFGSGTLLLVFLAAAALHEAAHLIAAKAMGLEVDRLVLSLLGAEIHLSEGCGASFLQDVALCLSGPLANLAAGAACALSGRFPLFLGANLLLGCFNLLPVLPLDGGGALFALASQLTDWDRAERIVGWLSRGFSLAVVLCGLAVLRMENGKPCLLALGLWLLGAAFFAGRN